MGFLGQKFAAITALATTLGATGLSADNDEIAPPEDDSFMTVQTINGVDGRVQVNDLPDVFIPDFFGPLENWSRNPAGRLAITQPSDSIGLYDRREMVKLGDHVFDPMLQMADTQGNGFCTATISIIRGFTTQEPGTIITTAAHCMEIRDADGNVIGHRDPNDVMFMGDYIDPHGQYQKFSFLVDQMWVDPMYDENKRADLEYFQRNGKPQDHIFERDVAVFFSKDQTPLGIIPASLYPSSLNSSLSASEQLSDAAEMNIDVTVTVAGHSADKPYLTVDPAAGVLYGDYDGINTNADYVPGASGGPIFINRGDEILKDENGRPMQIAVNSSLIIGTDTARHAYVNLDSLQTVPFLKADWDDACYQDGEVITDDLNIRVEPDATYQKLAAKPGETDSRLDRGASFVVHSILTNPTGQQWAFVTTDEGRNGYISANPDYVQINKPICPPQP